MFTDLYVKQCLLFSGAIYNYWVLSTKIVGANRKHINIYGWPRDSQWRFFTSPLTCHANLCYVINHVEYNGTPAHNNYAEGCYIYSLCRNVLFWFSASKCSVPFILFSVLFFYTPLFTSWSGGPLSAWPPL